MNFKKIWQFKHWFYREKHIQSEKTLFTWISRENSTAKMDYVIISQEYSTTKSDYVINGAIF